MARKMKKHKCPLCDSERIDVRHDLTESYRYLKKIHPLSDQEHTVCLDCGLDYFADGQIERNNQRFKDFAKTIVKDISPWEIHEIREKYLITQEDANRIFNCGSPTQFSKWERGECAPTGTAAIALRLALEEPETMRKLAARAGIQLQIEKEKSTAAPEQFHDYFHEKSRGTVFLKPNKTKIGKPKHSFFPMITQRGAVAISGQSYTGISVESEEIEIDVADQERTPAAWVINEMRRHGI